MAHTLDLGKDKLRKLVKTAAEATPRLPSVHTTDAYLFDEVLTAGKVEPQPCTVFKGEALTYLFYGRPAFRPNLDAEPTSLKHYFPICLIFKAAWVFKLKRVFPFDSGAFQKGFYGAHLHGRMKLGDFLLEADTATPGRVITSFFGSNPDYLMAKPKLQPQLDPTEFEAASYVSLITAKGGNAIDSRGSGVELQVEEALPLKDAVSAVVLPSSFADGETGKKLTSMGIDRLPYFAYERSRPTEYMSEITAITLRYYIAKQLVKESDL